MYTMDVNLTSCGNDFNIKSLCNMPEISNFVCQLYLKGKNLFLTSEYLSDSAASDSYSNNCHFSCFLSLELV